MSKCPWARYRTPNYSRWCTVAAIGVWEREAYDKVLWIKVLYKLSHLPFTNSMVWDKKHKEKKLDLLTLTVLRHLAICCGCTATSSFWGRGPWVGAGHHDTSPPGPSECPYETGGRSERTPHPLWLADSWGERSKAKRLDLIRSSYFPVLFSLNPKQKCVWILTSLMSGSMLNVNGVQVACGAGMILTFRNS